MLKQALLTVLIKNKDIVSEIRSSEIKEKDVVGKSRIERKNMMNRVLFRCSLDWLHLKF